MRKIFIFSCLVGLLGGCAWFGRTGKPHAFPKKIEKPHFTIPVGERMKFSVRWLGFEVGTAEVQVKEIVKIRGRDAYHITASVRSNRLISLLWPVRDEHHSYVDVEHLYSLRYEKKLREGSYRADSVIDYDQEAHKARYESHRSGTVKEMLIPKNVQDEFSSTFWFRMQEMKPGNSISIPVNVDEKNWNLQVKVLSWEMVHLKGFGEKAAVKVEPLATFQGLFLRRGRAWGWMGIGKHRIPLMMKTQIPVLGSITMVLTEYDLNGYHVRA